MACLQISDNFTPCMRARVRTIVEVYNDTTGVIPIKNVEYLPTVYPMPKVVLNIGDIDKCNEYAIPNLLKLMQLMVKFTTNETLTGNDYDFTPITGTSKPEQKPEEEEGEQTETPVGG